MEIFPCYKGNMWTIFHLLQLFGGSIMRILKTLSLLLIIISWIKLCYIGLVAPTLIRRPMSITIEKLKHLKIDSDSLETWEALRPISEFTKDTGNSVILFSILMIVGFIGYYLTAKKNKTSEPGSSRAQ